MSMVSLIVNFVPIILAIVLHELAHGYAAYRLGDNTAKIYGRLTLNPLKHVNLFGTILLPALLYFSQAGFMFGWAKPVPVDARNFRHPKRDMVLTALAGPLSNLVLACKVPVNIMYASTTDVNGKAMGQMIIQLPEEEADADRVIHYLKTVKIAYE
ncbi:MAG: site-2 protease family protein, partial [Alphaproteobacteria bacterium]|nr:site-2 protease family protein [Alphaproteobacteria bacterium]